MFIAPFASLVMPHLMKDHHFKDSSPASVYRWPFVTHQPSYIHSSGSLLTPSTNRPAWTGYRYSDKYRIMRSDRDSSYTFYRFRKDKHHYGQLAHRHEPAFSPQSRR